MVIAWFSLVEMIFPFQANNCSAENSDINPIIHYYCFINKNMFEPL